MTITQISILNAINTDGYRLVATHHDGTEQQLNGHFQDIESATERAVEIAPDAKIIDETE